MITGIWQDLRFGVRSLGRTPTFTLAAAVTLALGIGGSTAMFGLFEAVMLRKLPVEEPQALHFVAHGSEQGTGLGSNYPYFERVRALTEVFDGVAAYVRNDFKVSGGGPIEVTPGQFVSGNYHAVVGVPMRLGRGFTAEDDRAGAAASIAVISEGYWARRFGRDPEVIGRTLEIDGRAVSIVGVTAGDFSGFEPGARVDVTLPIALRALASPEFLTMHDTWTSMPLVARLRSGVTAEQALPSLDGVFQRYFAEPENAWLRGGSGAVNFANAWLLPAAGGEDGLRERYRTPLRLMLAMVGVLLLIACANVANLLLARGGVRSKEIAVRLSIGAARPRVVRQLLVESIQLSLLGGALGLVFAQAGVEAIVDLLASGANPILLDVQLNRTVLAFTIGLSTLTGIVFGLAPAFGVTRVDLAHALKVAGQGAANSHGWVSRHVLVGGQIALCVLLVSAAGLLGRTLRGLETREGGFERENVMMFTMDVEGTAFPAERFPQLCDELIDRLTPTYQLLAGSCSTSVPVHTRGNARPLVVPGGPSRSTEESLVFMNRISPEYFRAQGIQVVEGRALDSNDSESSEKVAVISRSAAAFFFGDENPIGRRVHFHNAEDVLFTVVGIVEDATQWSLRDDPFRTIYTPLTQLLEPETTLTVTLRSRRDPREFMGSVRAEVAALDSDVVVDYVRTMDQQIGGTLVRERVLALLSSAFGVVALVLSCVGLYGVIAYDVTRTARDIGIRLALGGQPGYVLGRVLGSAAGVTTLGVSIGLVATWFATRVLSSLLFGVTPRDPLTLAFAAAVIALTCLLAGYLPARRASRIDPVMVLRSE